jgi:uncharacterized protein with ParB-like and HNH nuclease domain
LKVLLKLAATNTLDFTEKRKSKMPQTRIESDKLFIKDVFQKWYRIPEYQRPYIWGSDQVNELLDDVCQAQKSNPNSQYFLGSMVLKKSNEQDGSTQYEEYDLLDGQQRLTTLFLITAVVRDLTPDSNSDLKKICQDAIHRKANHYDNIPERSRIVFDIRDDVRKFVDKYVKLDGGTSKTDELKEILEKSDKDISIKNIANAILVIQEFFTKDAFKNGNSIDQFFPFFRSNVLLIYVATEELEDAFHLFTVMNNRGIKLRNSDILKAENLSKIYVIKRASYARTWESIERYFAEDFDNFLSHIRTILVKQKAGYNLLKEYEDNIYNPKDFNKSTKQYIPKPPLLEKGEDTFKFVELYYDYYCALFEDSENQNFELGNQISLMKFGLEADYWIAPLLRYYDKFKNHNLIHFIKLLDRKFSADWIIGLSPTMRIENMNSIIKFIDDVDDPEVIMTSNVFNVQVDDLKRVLSGSVYGRRYARYLLLKLDLAFHGHNTKFSPPETVSIEHILPQNPSPSSQWSIDFDTNEREKWINRMGNLVLLSRRKNSAQSNLDFTLKKERYFRSNIELFSNSVRIFNTYNTWGLSDLTKNHKEVIKKIFALYAISISEADINLLLA